MGKRKKMEELKMNVPQTNAYIKEQAIAAINAAGLEGAGAVQIDDFSYAVPVDVAGVLQYAKVEITAANRKGTTRTAPFSTEAAIAKWEAKKAEQREKAEKKAADKAAAEAKKASKAKAN
jgi:hypothetical protein